MKRVVTLLLLVLSALALGGCEQLLLSQPASRDKLVSRIAADRALATVMTDRLLADDSTRALVVDRFMANGTAKQDFLLRVARDRTMMDGLLNVAAQDSVMRDHVVTLVRGIEMGGWRSAR